jgi:hypothetical protein
MQEISRLAEQLSASQEGLSSIDLFNVEVEGLSFGIKCRPSTQKYIH